MGNTPIGCGSDLPSVLGLFKNDPKSRSVNNSFQRLDLDPNSIKYVSYQPKPLPRCLAGLVASKSDLFNIQAFQSMMQDAGTAARSW